MQAMADQQKKLAADELASSGQQSVLKTRLRQTTQEVGTAAAGCALVVLCLPICNSKLNSITFFCLQLETLRAAMDATQSEVRVCPLACAHADPLRALSSCLISSIPTRFWR